MKYIIGIGNPGDKHKNNRHNVGFMVVDEMIGDSEWYKSKSGLLLYHWTKIRNKDIELLKPLTFMNKSGDAVGYVKKKHPKLKMNDLFIIHDDLDIKLGEYKIQKGKGPKDHKGLLSIYEKLKSRDFWHIRVGVENRDKENRISGEKYVLQNFEEAEMNIIKKTIQKIANELIKDFLIKN